MCCAKEEMDRKNLVIEYEGFTFDEWHSEYNSKTKEIENIWTEVCGNHAGWCKPLLSKDFKPERPIGICCVANCWIGCDTEGKRNHFIKFDLSKVKFTDGKNYYTLEEFTREEYGV